MSWGAEGNHRISSSVMHLCGGEALNSYLHSGQWLGCLACQSPYQTQPLPQCTVRMYLCVCIYVCMWEEQTDRQTVRQSDSQIHVPEAHLWGTCDESLSSAHSSDQRGTCHSSHQHLDWYACYSWWSQPPTQVPMNAVQFASNKKPRKELILFSIYIGVQHCWRWRWRESWGEMETILATYFSALPPRSLSPAWFCSTQWLAPQSCTHFCMM